MGYGVPNPRAGPDDKGSVGAKLMNMCCTFFICCTISMIAFSIMLAVTMTMDSILREEVQELKDDFKEKTKTFKNELAGKVDEDKVALELEQLHRALEYETRGLQNDVNAVGRQIDAAQRDKVDPEINCMIESIDHEYTPEVKPCCALLAKEVTAATDMKHYEHCVELLIRVKDGVSGDEENGLTIKQRGVDGWFTGHVVHYQDRDPSRKCPIKYRRTSLEYLCCTLPRCSNWESYKLRTMCHDCLSVCPRGCPFEELRTYDSHSVRAKTTNG